MKRTDALQIYLGARLYGLAWPRRYWLPSPLKHEYVALRFIPQASYKRPAQIHILPAPDVVTRVFMLFRGVRSDDVGLWAQTATRATEEDGATFWTKVGCVDGVRVSDHTSGVRWRLSELCKDSEYLLCVGNGTRVLYKNGVDILVRRLSLLGIFDVVFCKYG